MTEFWLTDEPTDGEQIGEKFGTNTGFLNLMNDPAEWAGISAETSVLQVYEAFTQQIPIAQQQSFYAWAAENNIPLSFNAGVTTLDDPDVAQYIAQFVSLGGTVSYLTMDEPLFIEHEDPAYAQVSINQLAENVAASIAQIKAAAPNVIVVDQEPVPATAPADLAEWCLAYETAVGTPLNGMQLDVDWNTGTATWEPALIAAVSTLEAVDVPPGIIINSEEPTNLGWTDAAIANYILCRALFGDTIATYDFQTWNPNPTDLLSDTAPGSLSDVEYAAGFYDQVTSAYQSGLGRVPTQTEYFSAMRALASGLLNLSTIAANLGIYGTAVPGTVVYQNAAAKMLAGSPSEVAISSNDETVVAGTSLTTIMCPIQYANDDFVGASPATTIVEFTGAGTILPGWAYETLATSDPFQLGNLTDNLTLKFSSNETITLDPTRDFDVELAGTNDVVNVTGAATLDLLLAQQDIGIAGSTTRSLDGKVGGNPGFSTNEFIGQGQSALDLTLSGTGHVTLDTLSNTLSVDGLPPDSMAGFGTFAIDNGDTFVVGPGDYTVVYASDLDTLLYSPQSRNVILENVTSGNLLLDFQGFGGLLSAATLAADTTTEDGNTFIDVPGAGTIELASYAGAIPLGDEIFGVACYRVGTHIATPDGQVAIERLAIGTVVTTASGAPRAIKWIGRRSYIEPFAARNRGVAPILMRGGALADGVPIRDLYVSPKHAMFLDGVLIPAERLLNGVSIVQFLCPEVHYMHVELSDHDLLLAEGAPSESFIDLDSRAMFQNAAEFLERCGEVLPVKECAARIEDGDILAAVRCRLATRAGLVADHLDDGASHGPLDGCIDVVEHAVISGWAYDGERPHTAVWLEIVVDGIPLVSCVANRFRVDLRHAGKGEGRCAFECRFPEPLSAAAHLVQVRRREDGAVLGEVPLPADPQKPGVLDGRIDHCSAVTIEGWALDLAHPAVPVRLEVLEGDHVIGQAMANRYRADLAQARKGEGRCSFVFRFTKSPEDRRLIRVRRASDEAWLPAWSVGRDAA